MTDTNLTDALVEATNSLQLEVDVLTVENKALRRSIGAYKANATRRKNQEENAVTENARLVQENQGLRRQVAAFRAAATRRASR